MGTPRARNPIGVSSRQKKANTEYVGSKFEVGMFSPPPKKGRSPHFFRTGSKSKNLVDFQQCFLPLAFTKRILTPQNLVFWEIVFFGPEIWPYLQLLAIDAARDWHFKLMEFEVFTDWNFSCPAVSHTCNYRYHVSEKASP